MNFRMSSFDGWASVQSAAGKCFKTGCKLSQSEQRTREGVGGEKGGDCRVRVSPVAVAPFEGDGGRLSVFRLGKKVSHKNNNEKYQHTLKDLEDIALQPSRIVTRRREGEMTTR
ncbi:hypothetical protein Baya_9855 [Bagarius yarrelli]|uniref:Uncharacterized protein n=1 Tax=Bagarius yarrelli TaxID=175774 RepID=A0A556U8T8_BAGYA|nr:hypothetical protein Baya_9855 [Bagarius yarrelli]